MLAAYQTQHLKKKRKKKLTTFRPLLGEETARTEPAKVRCNYIKTVYMIIGSQRETGPAGIHSQLRYRLLPRDEKKRRLHGNAVTQHIHAAEN